jgi:acetyltransferase-like isoleucine patch superfamily enzyme
MKYSTFFKVKSVINRYYWKIFYSHNFKKYGKKVNIFFPEYIEGEEFIRLSNNVYIGYKASIIVKLTNKNPDLYIGKGTKIRRFSHITCINKIRIGSNVLVADNVLISDNYHNFSSIEEPIRTQGLSTSGNVEIGSGSWIGQNSCILSVSIGKNCIIGANSVVLKDIPDFSMAVGNPAKVVKKFDRNIGTWVGV